MRKTVCAGCGLSEPLDAKDKKTTIATFKIVGDEKVRSWEQEEEYSEDLCFGCIDSILATYFGVVKKGAVADPPVMRLAAGAA